MPPIRGWIAAAVIAAALPLALLASVKSDWRNALKEDTVSAYEYYLQKHPNSEYSGEAERRIEHLVWKDRTRSDTPGDYRSFLRRYPQSQFAPQAVSRIQAIEEQMWGEARGARSEVAYDRFLSGFPESTHAQEAREAITSIQELRKWRGWEVTVVEASRTTEIRQAYTEFVLRNQGMRPGTSYTLPLESKQGSFLLVRLAFKRRSGSEAGREPEMLWFGGDSTVLTEQGQVFRATGIVEDREGKLVVTGTGLGVQRDGAVALCFDVPAGAKIIKLRISADLPMLPIGEAR